RALLGRRGGRTLRLDGAFALTKDVRDLGGFLLPRYDLLNEPVDLACRWRDALRLLLHDEPADLLRVVVGLLLQLRVADLVLDRGRALLRTLGSLRRRLLHLVQQSHLCSFLIRRTAEEAADGASGPLGRCLSGRVVQRPR